MVNKGPIFLAGVDRSGIGLLGELLEAHPNIAISRRTNFWSFYLNRFGDLSQPQNFERCLAEMMRNSRIQRLQPQPERLRHEFPQGEPTYSRLFALLEEHNMERLGKSRWGDKSLGAERYADIVLTAYPEAKMIHIIRDPRDRYASQFNHRGVGKGELGAGAALWSWSVRLAERNKRRYGERYKIVQYETLAREPESLLHDLCDFIGERYSPDMLMISNDSMSEADLAPAGSLRVMRTTSIGRFETDLSKQEIAFIQMCTHRKMLRYGYQPHLVSLPGTAKLVFYLINCPVNLTRMFLWQPWAGIKEVLGKTPSARRLVHPS
jgi:hypothetical protein